MIDYSLLPSDMVLKSNDMPKKEWLAFRQKHEGFGCSEIGTIRGLNKWKTPAMLYYQKTGLHQYSNELNEAMYWGTIEESSVADAWEYWDHDKGYLENVEVGYKERQCFEFNHFAYREVFPYLYGEPDRLFYHEDRLCPLEIKTINTFSMKQEQLGFPESYLDQVHGYMFLFDALYCEMAIKDSDRKLHVFRIERDEERIQSILQDVFDFWNLCAQGIELVSQGLIKEAEALAPEVIGNDEQLMKDYYAEKIDSEAEYNEEMEEHVEQYDIITGTISSLNKQKKDHKAKILQHMGLNKWMKTSMYKVSNDKKFTVSKLKQ